MARFHSCASQWVFREIGKKESNFIISIYNGVNIHVLYYIILI